MDQFGNDRALTGGSRANGSTESRPAHQRAVGRPTLLKELLRQRHLLTYRRFRKEYERVARQLDDKDLVGTAPSERQYMRWLSGRLTRLPNSEPRAVLEAMFPGHTAEKLFFTRHQQEGLTPTSDAGRAAPGDISRISRAAVDVQHEDFLARIVVETPVPSRVGWSDVEHVRATTRAVATAENTFGGGLSCEAAIGQLRWAGKLLRARADEHVRRAMLEAVGNLSSVVAYSAFDISNYSAADRCFEFSLWCADQSGSWPLRANTLAEMSRKAAYLGNLDDALSLIEFAQVRADRVSATARAMMWTIRALLLASTGRHTEARSDIARADACFHDRDPDADPPWLTYYDLAEHQGSIGKALIPIAQAEKHVEPAAARLESAIQLHRQNYPRSRAFSRARLATLMMDIGDPQEAASIGRQAVDEAAPLRSDRITKELHNLAEASRPYSRMSDVSDLRNDIVELTQLEV